MIELFSNSIEWIGEWGFLFKSISAIVSAVLLFFAIHYMILMDYFSPYKKYNRDIRKYGGSYLQRVPDEWRKILNLVIEKDPVKWKQSILLADGLLLEVLKTSSHRGSDVVERLFSASKAKISYANELIRSREEIFMKINNDQDLTQKETKEALQLYRAVLREFGVLE